MLWWIFFGVIFLFLFANWWTTWRHLWRGKTPHAVALIFLQPRMAVRPSVLKHPLPDAYRLSCLFFGAGLIDRTQTLDQGFPYKVLDPIPDVGGTVPDIASICRERAAALVAQARAENLPIRLLWSGGIDSTAACTALLQALTGEPERLEIAYSKRSRSEYRRFYNRYVKTHPRQKRFDFITDALAGDALIVTGEHGDQLFGSMKAISCTRRSLLPPWNDTTAKLFAPWQNEFPQMLKRQLASAGRADTVMEYLKPQFAACPIALHSLFDLLWWFNFSMKWQAVSLRLAAFMPEDRFAAKQSRLHHFFQTADFQRWSLTNPEKRIGKDWKSYKWPLKAFIRDFTGDGDYFAKKEKEPSMRGLVKKRAGRATLAIDAEKAYLWQPQDESLRRKLGLDTAAGVSVGVTFSYSQSREAELWAELSEGE